MSKLKLSLEQLAVESFASVETADARGTVRGQEDTEWETCGFNYSCANVETCGNWATCYMDCTMDCSFRPHCV
jgi:hypothetical protein